MLHTTVCINIWWDKHLASFFKICRNSYPYWLKINSFSQFFTFYVCYFLDQRSSSHLPTVTSLHPASNTKTNEYVIWWRFNRHQTWWSIKKVTLQQNAQTTEMKCYSTNVSHNTTKKINALFWIKQVIYMNNK